MSEEEKKSATADNKKVSLEQENRIAKMFNASRTPRSGGGEWKKGDILSEDWLVECKTTTTPAKSFSVSKAVLDKAEHERAEMHKSYMALAFTLGEDYDDYFVLDKRAMSAVLEQRAAMKALYLSLQKRLTELDVQKEQLRITQDLGGAITKRDLTEQEQTLYNAHRQEILGFIEELERML